MPELPEVETIVRGLRRRIVGKTIAGAEVRLGADGEAPAGVDFARAVCGERIAAIGRRGKYSVLSLESGAALVVSLRMTGRLIVSAPRAAADASRASVVLRFSDGARLHFSDVRTFGRMRLVEAGEAWDRALGVEPLSSGFTPEAFIGMLAGRTSPIKAFLLDQHRIAGIGNIYACEALWEGSGRPTRPAGALTKAVPAAYVSPSSKFWNAPSKSAERPLTTMWMPRARGRFSKPTRGLRQARQAVLAVRLPEHRADGDRAAGYMVVPTMSKIKNK